MSKNWLLDKNDYAEFHSFIDAAVKRCKTTDEIQWVYDELSFELVWAIREAAAIKNGDLDFDPIILEVRNEHGTT